MAITELVLDRSGAPDGPNWPKVSVTIDMMDWSDYEDNHDLKQMKLQRKLCKAQHSDWSDDKVEQAIRSLKIINLPFLVSLVLM